MSLFTDWLSKRDSKYGRNFFIAEQTEDDLLKGMKYSTFKSGNNEFYKIQTKDPTDPIIIRKNQINTIELLKNARKQLGIVDEKEDEDVALPKPKVEEKPDPFKGFSPEVVAEFKRREAEKQALKEELIEIYGDNFNAPVWQNPIKVAAGIINAKENEILLKQQSEFFKKNLKSSGPKYWTWQKDQLVSSGLKPEVPNLPIGNVPKGKELPGMPQWYKNKASDINYKFQIIYGRNPEFWQQSAKIAAGLTRPRNTKEATQASYYAKYALADIADADKRGVKVDANHYLSWAPNQKLAAGVTE